MHPNKWPLKKLSACISMVLLTLSSQQKAFADNWVVSHPWIVVDEDNHVPDDFGNLPNIFDPQDYTDNGGNLETGDQRPLKVLYRPAIDSVLDKSGSRLILRTNLFTLDGSNAINISDGTLDGIHIDNMTVWSVDGPGPLEDFNKAAIHIGNPGGDEIALVGSIKNSGNVKGGIYITGEARPITGSVYESAGTNATGGKATLDGGFVVKNNGIAESIDDHAINLQSNAYTDFIVSDINSRISATGENSSAIYVAEGGQLGGAPVYTHQIATLEAVVNSNIDPITGYNQVGDRDDLILPDDESNYIKVDLDSDGNVDDSDNDGNKDLYKQVDFALNNTLSPDISRSSTDKVISIKGQLTSAESTAIKIDGFVSGQIHIAEGGQLTGGLDNVNIDDLPEKAVIWVRNTDSNGVNDNTYTGSVFNEGTVNGGIFIHGTHLAPAGESLYRSLGTQSNTTELNGSYTVKYGGQAIADERAIYIDHYSTINKIEVSGTNADTVPVGSLLSSSSNSAIYVEEQGVIGDMAAPTDAAIIVSDSATIEGNKGIVVNGSVYGKIHVDDAALTSTAGFDAVAIDFSDANSALLFKQSGSNAATTGSIIASSSRNDDKVEILGGTFTGNILSGIDELVASTGANITVGGTNGFTLPAKTTLMIDEGFASSGAVINIPNGALTVNESLITIKPSSLQAYRELTLATGDTTIVVADGNSVIGNTDNVSTTVAGLALNFVTDTGNLLKAKDVEINGNQLEVTVTAVDPTSFADNLINSSLSETDAIVAAAAVTAIAPTQMADPIKAEALFQMINSTTDFETLTAQLAEPIEVAARSDIAVMNTTQNITLSEARGQINGFSYGDGFNSGEVWGQAIYSESNQIATSGKTEFKGKTNGYIIGIGLNLTENWLAGISGAITTTHINGDQQKKLKTSSYISSLYSHWADNDWFFDSLLTVGRSNNDTLKYVSTEQVEADFGSWLWGAKFIAGKQYTTDYWSIAPQFELNYGHVHFDPYTSRGNSGAESRVKASDYEVMELGSGFQVHNTSWLAHGAIRPELSIMGYYDIKNQGSQFQSSYLAGGDAFIVTEAERDRFRLHSSFGLSVDVLEYFTINAAYTHNWSKHYQAHSFSAKANYKF